MIPTSQSYRRVECDGIYLNMDNFMAGKNTPELNSGPIDTLLAALVHAWIGPLVPATWEDVVEQAKLKTKRLFCTWMNSKGILR